MVASPCKHPVSRAVSQAGASGGDDTVFRSAAFALGCGAVGSAAAAFGCESDVLRLFAPELSWLLLAPSLLIALLGAVGLCASGRATSRLFRAQFGTILFCLAAILAAVGVWVAISSETVAVWVSEGCEGHSTLGIWEPAGRIAQKMRGVHEQYTQMR